MIEKRETKTKTQFNFSDAVVVVVFTINAINLQFHWWLWITPHIYLETWIQICNSLRRIEKKMLRGSVLNKSKTKMYIWCMHKESESFVIKNKMTMLLASGIYTLPYWWRCLVVFDVNVAFIKLPYHGRWANI